MCCGEGERKVLGGLVGNVGLSYGWDLGFDCYQSTFDKSLGTIFNAIENDVNKTFIFLTIFSRIKKKFIFIQAESFPSPVAFQLPLCQLVNQTISLEKEGCFGCHPVETTICSGHCFTKVSSEIQIENWRSVGVL